MTFDSCGLLEQVGGKKSISLLKYGGIMMELDHVLESFSTVQMLSLLRE